MWGCVRRRILGPTWVRTLWSAPRRSLSNNNGEGLREAGGGHSPMYCCLDESRGILRLVGRDVFSFSQGLLTNDIWLLDTLDPSPMYAAKLNPRGRVQYDVILHPDIRQRKEEEEEVSYLMEVGKESVDDLRNVLLRYRLRAVVDIHDVSEDYKVWTHFGPKFANPGGLPIDPRLPGLGARFVRPASWKPDEKEVPDLVWSTLHNKPKGWFIEGAPSDYKYWRIKHGVGEGPVEITSGGALPLEHNMDQLNGISFKKGCYIGQELTARTHFQGKIRKRLMPAVIKDGSPGVGEALITESGGKSIGEVRAVERDFALVFVRLQPTISAIVDGAGYLMSNRSMSKLEPQVPGWWPPEWIRDEAPT